VGDIFVTGIAITRVVGFSVEGIIDMLEPVLDAIVHADIHYAAI
jgi:hydroxylamine reductase (hybrid-cluster protein)